MNVYTEAGETEGQRKGKEAGSLEGRMPVGEDGGERQETGSCKVGREA